MSTSVMLAVACMDHKVNTVFLEASLRSQMALAARGIPLQVAHIDGCCHVDDAYNYLLRLFLASEFTHCVTVGSDQGWRGEDLVRLVEHGQKYHVVAGIVPKKSDDPQWNVLYQQDTLQANDDGVIECDMIGTGFMCLSRHAVETLAARAERFAMNEFDDVPLIIERRVIGRKRFSGDNVLCLKWHEEDGEIYADPYGHFTHVGTKTWHGCAADWYRSRIAPTPDAVHEVYNAMKGVA